jgi:hypothetical protein
MNPGFQKIRNAPAAEKRFYSARNRFISAGAMGRLVDLQRGVEGIGCDRLSSLAAGKSVSIDARSFDVN